jgi:hypothetical protein
VYGFMPPGGAGACSVAIPMMFSPQIWMADFAMLPTYVDRAKVTDQDFERNTAVREIEKCAG